MVLIKVRAEDYAYDFDHGGHRAVGEGKNYFVQKLLNSIQNEELLEEKNNKGHTALHIAALVGNKYAAKLLVKKRDNLLYVKDKLGEVPLLTAYSNNHISTFVYLFKATKAAAELLPTYQDSFEEFIIRLIYRKEYVPVAILYPLYQLILLFILVLLLPLYMFYSLLWKVLATVVVRMKNIEQRKREYEEAHFFLHSTVCHIHSCNLDNSRFYKFITLGATQHCNYNKSCNGVRDSVQLETAVNTISHEYLLEFTSEYGISEMLHPELPGPGDRIVDFPEGKVDERVFPTVVDWRTNASKDGMPVNGTYFVEAVRALDTHRTLIQKQPEMLLCLVGISRRYYLGDEVNGPIQFDSCPKSYKGEDWESPSCPHEVPLLTLTASPVIEMDEPAGATDSFRVSSTTKKSPLDFANKGGASDQGTAAPGVPPSEDVPATAAHESLRRDHADLRPSGSSHGGKSLAAMQLCLASNVFVSEGAHANVSDPDPSSPGVVAVKDPEFENASSPTEVGSPGSVYRPELGVTNGNLLDTLRHMARRDKRIEAREFEIKNLEALLETEADMKRAAEDKSAGLIKELEDMRARFSDLQVSHGQLSQQVASLKEQVSGEKKLKAAFEQFKQYEDEQVEQRCAELDARLDALSIDFDEELYPHMLTAIAGRRWIVGHGLRLAMMKCAESLEMRQAFVDVVSAGVAKGMSEGLKHGVEHGRAQLTVESIKAYDPEAKAKFVAALQSLKDLKYHLLDQLEGLKDAPMDVIMAALYLEIDTEGMPYNIYATSVPAPLSSSSLCTRSRAEKKKKCRIECRTHGAGSAHHAMSNDVLVSVPTVVPQGLALLLVDAATQTDLEDA
nr:ankyrin repeat-containing protein [Tanacetum cinerariifolium]